MFGYVNVNRKSLSEEEEKVYRSFYCGMCHALKDNYGTKSQLLLNYDTVFLALLLSGLYEPQEEVKPFTCALHPTKKHEKVESDIMNYSASMGILLSYHQLMDDWKDNHSVAKKSAAGILRKDYEKAAALYPRQAKAVETYIRELNRLESEQNQNADVVSGLTGVMLGELFDYREDEWSEELKILGLYLGKFIYLMDACMDLETDHKKGSYNPFSSYYGKDNELFFRSILSMVMGDAIRAFDIMPLVQDVGILKNVLCDGLWQQFNKKFKKEEGPLDESGSV